MQVNINNIQRPTLFQEFFDKLITYSNEVIEYINTTTIKSVTSIQHDNVVSIFNNIKNTIKNIYTQIINAIKNINKSHSHNG